MARKFFFLDAPLYKLRQTRKGGRNEVIGTIARKLLWQSSHFSSLLGIQTSSNMRSQIPIAKWRMEETELS